MPLGIAWWLIKRLFVLAAPVILALLILFVGWKTLFLVDWRHLPAQPAEWPNHVASVAAQVVQEDITPRLPQLAQTGTEWLSAWCDGVERFVAKVTVTFLDHLLQEWTSRHGAPPLESGRALIESFSAARP